MKTTDGGPGSTTPPFEPAEATSGFYVYLCSGNVECITPADSMALSADKLEICLHGQTVALFQRSEVFSCSRTPLSGPVLG